MAHKTYFNWSTGKDSALSLYKMLQDDRFSVQVLLTSMNSEFDRVSMHGIRRSLVEAQAKSVGLPLRTIELPGTVSMEEYQALMREQVEKLQQEGYTRAGFGDIFLEDLRQNRIDKLQPYNIQCEFPVWKIDTKELIREFLRLGFKTIVVSTQGHLGDFCGRIVDEAFLADLPEDVDPCFENGEMHTFAFDGPLFKEPIQFVVGEKVYREYKDGDKAYGYWYCDLLPVGEEDVAHQKDPNAETGKDSVDKDS